MMLCTDCNGQIMPWNGYKQASFLKKYLKIHARDLQTSMCNPKGSMVSEFRRWGGPLSVMEF